MGTGQCATLVCVDTGSDVTRLVTETARRIRRARMDSLAPYGLTPHQAGAFLVIGHQRAGHDRSDPDRGDPGGELRVSDLARRLRIAPRSATEVVDALCASALVAREPSTTDRRATSLVLTARGQGLIDDVRRASPATSVFAALTEGERETLGTLLRKVLDTPTPEEIR